MQFARTTNTISIQNRTVLFFIRQRLWLLSNVIALLHAYHSQTDWLQHSLAVIYLQDDGFMWQLSASDLVNQYCHYLHGSQLHLSAPVCVLSFYLICLCFWCLPRKFQWWLWFYSLMGRSREEKWAVEMHRMQEVKRIRQKGCLIRKTISHPDRYALKGQRIYPG